MPPSTSTSSANTNTNKKPARPPTAFERRVYEATSAIPRGRVSTYGEVARLLGSSPRAVGGALRRNPFAPAVPCHRVVARNGALTGYRWGVDRKRALLEREAAQAQLTPST